MTGMAATAGTMTAGAIPNGFDRAVRRSIEMHEKPPESGGFFAAGAALKRSGNIASACWTSGGRFAKRRALAKAFRAGSGRIAQLVEQMTLNHRVPGSSPGAPTIATQ
jgi:hypothetical protein